MKIQKIVFFLSMAIPFLLQAQFIPEKTAFFSNDGHKLNANFKFTSFFKNNEYFNSLEEGYTLLGYVAEPKIILQVFDDFRLSAGLNLLKYSGRKGYSEVEPIFRVQYQPTIWFQMIMGNIMGSSYHRLFEPLYRWEREFTNPVESGLQFLFKTSYLDADIWLDWQKFIFHGDPFQEELTVGIRSDFYIPFSNPNAVLDIPIQSLIEHHGGQINTGVDTMQTIANGATGIQFKYTTSNKLFRKWELGFLYFSYGDLSPTKRQYFKGGYGLYPLGSIQINYFTLQLGYYYGYKFAAPFGEALLHSINIPFTGIYSTYTNLITGKILFEKEIHPGIILGTYVESYSNLNTKRFDFDYGLHIKLNKFLFDD